MKFNSETARKAGKKSSRKGSPNKATADLRERVSALLDGQFEQIVSDLEQLDPRERVNAYIKLMEYALPKLNRTSVSGPDGEPIGRNLPAWMDEPPAIVFYKPEPLDLDAE